MSITPTSGVPAEAELQFRPWDDAATITSKISSLERQLEWALMRRFNFDCFIKPYSSYTSSFLMYFPPMPNRCGIRVRCSDAAKFGSILSIRYGTSTTSVSLSSSFNMIPGVPNRFFTPYANGTAPSGWASTTAQTRIQFVCGYSTGEQDGYYSSFMTGPGFRSDAPQDYEHAMPFFMKTRQALSLGRLPSCAYNSMIDAAKQIERIPVMHSGAAYFNGYFDDWSSFNVQFFVALDPDLGGRQHILTLAFYATGGPTRFRVTVGAYTLTAKLIESPASTTDVYEYEVDLSMVVEHLEPDFFNHGRSFYRVKIDPFPDLKVTAEIRSWGAYTGCPGLG